MRKKEIIKKLERDNELLRLINSEQTRKIEILQFKLDKGENPVEFISTGSMHIVLLDRANKKAYQKSSEFLVKYITPLGDIHCINLGFLACPTFKIKRNNERECIFSICENEGPLVRWFKLFKGKMLVVDIPEPSFVIDEECEACCERGADDE